MKKDDHVSGDIPYVSSTAENNGIDGFIGNHTGVRIFSNCITLANRGSVGSAFFHAYSFIGSDHVTSLERQELDRYAYLFMLPSINKLSEKYSFNREINDARISHEHLLLPSTPDGAPDWVFMAAYMRQQEQAILSEVLSKLEARLAQLPTFPADGL